MEVTDAFIGRLFLVATLSVFLVLVFWVNTHPFIDKESLIYEHIPHPKWLLVFCATWGLFFIGGLMSFTLYHIYPHL